MNKYWIKKMILYAACNQLANQMSGVVRLRGTSNNYWFTDSISPLICQSLRPVTHSSHVYRNKEIPDKGHKKIVNDSSLMYLG